MIMQRYISAGYASAANLADLTESGDVRKLTHLNVAFGHVRDDEIRTDHLQPYMNELKKLKFEYPELTVLLSVGDGPRRLFRSGLHGNGPQTDDGIGARGARRAAVRWHRSGLGISLLCRIRHRGER